MAHINWKLIIGGFVALGVVPITLLVCMHFLNSVFLGDSSNDGWLGFWGGYLGALLGLYGVQMQLKSEQKTRLDDNHPKFYLFFRMSFEPSKKVYVNSCQPPELLRSKDHPKAMKFESKYSYSDSNFISIINSNKKNIYDISILVTSLVADNNVCSKYKKSSVNINGKEGKGDNSEWDSFKRDTKNWSLVHESIKASNLENTENELLLVTYAQLFNYPNEIKSIDIIFHTNSNEIGLAMFKLIKDKNGIPKLSNVPNVEYFQEGAVTHNLSEKEELFNKNYKNTAIMVVDENNKEPFIWEKRRQNNKR
ncbi:hypothetical protein [Lactiplantibacillus plantarum]|uniref:hypothetical protein n=1 Tax=Lactiplantibacillus plantarum TaxID=1590 RepID=UPI002650A02A|nr:hypothetical protein [Lactiplantibacillus plantarum]MDN7045575.1 hypothetical protein [Lactiplantibacillus plantarum]MDN7064238.1 hypothetical protein [Lactiplantibacillus plantarum]MDN7070041.1 hypothetical protein [Lactiplantibacillus plantarum]